MQEEKIREGLHLVQEKIARAAEKSGRSASDVTLIAVTKTHDASVVRCAVEAGACDVGENRAQEVLEKYDAVIPRPRWHFIGHLQKNKVKYIIDKVCMIQSLDSLSAAQEIERQAQKYGIVMPVLIQVNIGREPQKSGIAPDELHAFWESLQSLTHLNVQGLMTVPPHCPTPEDVRPYFAAMRELFDTARSTYAGSGFSVLSMGMSEDYVIAIEEGATMVRVGSAIFGAR